MPDKVISFILKTLVVETLLKRGANPDIHRGNRLDYPLHMIISRTLQPQWRGNKHMKDIIRLLLRYGANPNLKISSSGKTAIDIALPDANLLNILSGANYLNDELLDICRTRSQGYGGSSSLNRVRSLLEQGADMFQRDIRHISALEYVNRTRDYYKVMMLYIPNINITYGRNNDIPLIVACYKGWLDVVKIIIDRNANLNIKGDNGLTPLMVACQKSDEDIVRLLLNKGANPNIKDNKKHSVLNFACSGLNINIIRLLLDKGANPNIKCGSKNCTQLVYMCCGKEEYPYIVNLLLKKGANINIKDDNQYTPLMYACKNGHSLIVRMLLNEGANPNPKSNDEYTPLELACKNGHSSTVSLLLNKGARVSMKMIRLSKNYPYISRIIEKKVKNAANLIKSSYRKHLHNKLLKEAKNNWNGIRRLNELPKLETIPDYRHPRTDKRPKPTPKTFNEMRYGSLNRRKNAMKMFEELPRVGLRKPSTRR